MWCSEWSCHPLWVSGVKYYPKYLVKDSFIFPFSGALPAAVELLSSQQYGTDSVQDQCYLFGKRLQMGAPTFLYDYTISHLASATF